MLPVAASIPDDANLIQLLNGFAVPGSRLAPADLEFKSDFDGNKPAWLDILKHIVAMANFGGGTLVFSVDRDGNRVGLRSPLLQVFDPANISNKLASYTSARVPSSYRELFYESKLFGFLQVSPCEKIIVVTLLKFGSRSEFIRRARNAGTTFEIDGKSYVIAALLNDRNSATAVFEKLVQLDCDGRINEKLRAFANRHPFFTASPSRANRDAATKTKISQRDRALTCPSQRGY